VSFLNPLYEAVAWLLVHIHDGIRHVITNNGWSWAVSIILLTMAMRLVLFPIFVKQIKNQRAMQAVQPKMKELQAKYKHDKEKLNQEMMALWKEAGANPLSGCLPLLLQIPIFVSLFHTLREIKPTCHTVAGQAHCLYKGVPGFSSANIASAAHAKIFGVPIPASFSTSSTTLHLLGADGAHTSTRVLAILLTVIMGATTFITQRQLMARNGPAADSQMAQQQKILLYVFPLVFLIYGFKFPIGVLLYWLTTNLWSMVQQRVIINRMEHVDQTASPAVTPSGPAVGAKPKTPPRASAPRPAPSPTAKPASAGGDITLPPGGAIPSAPARPSTTKRSPNTRRSKNRKRGRR
jgi:YidC/Oxa1 family membrane protein insertase